MHQSESTWRPQPDSADSDIAELVEQVEAQIANQPFPPHALSKAGFFGRSVTIPDTCVDVRIGRRLATDFGSFATNVRPYAVTAHVHAYPSEHGVLRPAKKRTEITDFEAEAFLKVTLGQYWTDYAYQLHVQVPDRLQRQIPPFQKVFVVVVDGHDKPMLAPDNFRWGSIFFTRSEPRKLTPSRENTALRQHLSEAGPYADSSRVRDPRTEPDGAWKVDMSGDTLDTLTHVARQAVEAAYKIFRRRGSVSTDFRTVRIVVDGTTLHVHFQWKKNPNTFAIAIRIPQFDSDFRSPPIHNPSAWMSEAASNYDEELSTGYMTRAQRSVVDGGVVLLHNPSRGGPPHDHYITATTPGYASEKKLRAHGMNVDDCIAASSDGRLISWLNLHPSLDFVAHAATVWSSEERVAELSCLEELDGVPEEALRQLVWVLVNETANVGARYVVTDLVHPVLEQVGFERTAQGNAVYDVIASSGPRP